jgi:hypothetical protein
MVHWTGPTGLPGWANQTRSTQSIGDPTDTSSPLPPCSRLCSTPTPPTPPAPIPASLGHSGCHRWLQRTSTRGSTPPPCSIRPAPPLVAALNPSGARVLARCRRFPMLLRRRSNRPSPGSDVVPSRPSSWRGPARLVPWRHYRHCRRRAVAPTSTLAGRLCPGNPGDSDLLPKRPTLRPRRR